MAGKIAAIQTIKEHSLEDCTESIGKFIEEHQAIGHACKVQFVPLMQPNGKVLYVALVEARE
jgi:hypothetical protein